jgi:transposase
MRRSRRNATDKNDASGVAQLVRSAGTRCPRQERGELSATAFADAHRRALKRKIPRSRERDPAQPQGVRGEVERGRARRFRGSGARVDRRRRAAGGADRAGAAGAGGVVVGVQRTRFLVRMVGRDELCRRFMAVPGVALIFKTTVDDPAHFKRSQRLEGVGGRALFRTKWYGARGMLPLRGTAVAQQRVERRLAAILAADVAAS